MRVELARAAERDLEAALEYLSDRNPGAARALRANIQRAIESLEDFPDRGRPAVAEGGRELPVQGAPYIIVYAIDGETVFVARIRHTSRDPAP